MSPFSFHFYSTCYHFLGCTHARYEPHQTLTDTFMLITMCMGLQLRTVLEWVNANKTHPFWFRATRSDDNEIEYYTVWSAVWVCISVFVDVSVCLCAVIFVCYAMIYWWMMMTESFFFCAFEWILHWKMKLWYKIERCQKIGYDVSDWRYWRWWCNHHRCWPCSVCTHYIKPCGKNSRSIKQRKVFLITIGTSLINRLLNLCNIRISVDTCSSKILVSDKIHVLWNWHGNVLD